MDNKLYQLIAVLKDASPLPLLMMSPSVVRIGQDALEFELYGGTPNAPIDMEYSRDDGWTWILAQNWYGLRMDRLFVAAWLPGDAQITSYCHKTFEADWLQANPAARGKWLYRVVVDGLKSNMVGVEYQA